jgi:AraC family transcriptional regulator, regulatory protein of adaptative response / methylated-DNA-[protein]-cysteine methyltransferase
MVDGTDFKTEDSRWEAVESRDQSAAGAFIYAVATTGIYCRPGCSSRRPKRENVVFFHTPEAAERSGYRPCRRCGEGNVSSVVARACERIADSETPPALADLAAEAGLSPSHFHRLFKGAVGVTPKQYALSLRADSFRAGLRKAGTVTEIIYDAGFGSSSRAYEKAVDRLGMTPTDFRKGGAGLDLHYVVAPCYLGLVGIALSKRGICAIEFGDDGDVLVAQLRDLFPKARWFPADRETAQTVGAVVAFIERPGSGLAVPLHVQGTAFQQRVWAALRDVPSGVTVSYAEIARRVGLPKGARAVARACASNRIAVAIPCHRVIRGDGGPGGYRWGIERKRSLLSREAGLGPQTAED